MNNNLRVIIQNIQKELKNEPDAPIIGKMSDGNLKINDANNINLKEYIEFLKECDGARCGAIDFVSFDEIPDIQYRVTDIPGGNDVWICIGQILYEPLVINKTDGNVYLYYQGHEDEVQPKSFGSFDYFLMEYVFGKKYAEIIPDADQEEWYQFLKKLKLV